MNLRQRKIVNYAFDHFFSKIDLPAPPTKEELDSLVPNLINGSLEARDEIVLKHIRLISEISGRYVASIHSTRLADEFISSALLATVTVVEKIRLGIKKMYDNNITGVIVEAVHSAISKTLEQTPIISVPGSTRRSAILEGKEPPLTPKCFHLNNSERRSVEEFDPEANVDKQGWWRDTVRRKLILEIEIRECLDQVIQSPLERDIVELRTTYVDGKPMSDRKIADHLGINCATVNIIRRDIGERLRKELDE